jgi:hypothetical protein
MVTPAGDRKPLGGDSVQTETAGHVKP